MLDKVFTALDNAHTLFLSTETKSEGGDGNLLLFMKDTCLFDSDANVNTNLNSTNFLHNRHHLEL